MKPFKSLIKGKLIKRYKRFFVDVKIDGLIFNYLDTSKASYYGYYQYGGYYNKYKSYS